MSAHMCDDDMPSWWLVASVMHPVEAQTYCEEHWEMIKHLPGLKVDPRLFGPMPSVMYH